MMLLRPSAASGLLRKVSTGLVAAALLVCAAAAAAAQTPSLADVAKKEQQRRKKVPAPQKVYTNKDLPSTPESPPAAPAAATTPTPIPQEPAVTAAQKPGDEKDEAWWRARMASAQEEVRRNQVFLEALQSRVNALSADFVNRDDPYQRAKIGEDRQKTLAEIDRVTRELEEGKKNIENLEEEARKAGVPPGWLR